MLTLTHKRSALLGQTDRQTKTHTSETDRQTKTHTSETDRQTDRHTPLRFFIWSTAILRMDSLSNLRGTALHAGIIVASSVMYRFIRSLRLFSTSQCWNRLIMRERGRERGREGEEGRERGKERRGREM